MRKPPSSRWSGISTLPRLVPQAGTRERRPCRRRRSSDHQARCSKAPFSPLIAQLTDRAGMMVSPKAAKAAGDKFGLHPVCAGPYKFVERVQQDRIVLEKFADYWNKDNVFIDRIVYLPIVDATVRLANLKSGGLDLIERVLATDIKDVRADSRLKVVDRDRARLSGHHAQHRQGQGQGSARASPPRSGRRSTLDRPRGDQPGRVQRRVQARQSVDQPGPSLLPEGVSGPPARRRQGQGAVEGSRRHAARSTSTSWCRRARRPKPSPRSCSRWPRKPAST